MIDLNGIKNIIFDLGGVILNINPKLTIQSLKQLGVFQAERLFTDFSASNILHKLETGKCSNNEFFSFIKQHSIKNINFNQINEAWNAMLLDIPAERIELIKQLKTNFKIYLLSNTNHIHYKHFQLIFCSATNAISIENFFVKTFFSFEIKLRKPNIDIFKFVLNDQNLKAEETLFIDDSLENIEAAKLLGLKTYWLTNELENNFDIKTLKKTTSF